MNWLKRKKKRRRILIDVERMKVFIHWRYGITALELKEFEKEFIEFCKNGNN